MDSLVKSVLGISDDELVWKPCWKKPVEVQYREVRGDKEEIETREGKLFGYKGQDFIIKGVNGEIYPIKKDIFDKTYTIERVREKRIAMCFDAERLMLVERALDLQRTMIAKTTADLIMAAIKAKEDGKLAAHDSIMKEVDNNVRYWDIAMELMCVVKDERDRLHSDTVLKKR
jgi:hypothetical protein